MKSSTRQQSALKFILIALIPYSRQNMVLSFSPNRFFYELERNFKYSQPTLRRAYNRGRQRGLIDQCLPKLTRKGSQEVQPFVASRLKGNANLMVIFDIPELNANSRQQLRSVLKHWKFNQIQKSVWMTDLDHKDALVDLVNELNIASYVEIYESARLFPVI